MTLVPGEIPGWVPRALGTATSGLHRIPWGFTNETWTGTDPEGGRIVATLMTSPARARSVLARAPAVAQLLTEVGLETPVPIPERSEPERAVIVHAWLDGIPGMIRLGEADGPRAVGLAAGDAWRRLGDADPANVDLDDLWARPSALVAAARRWLSGAQADLSTSHVAIAADRIDQLGGPEDGVRRFVHGDLVPANLLLREGGPPVVLDLETVRIGDPLLDAGWFSWIVRFHHPAAWQAAWGAFAEAAHLTDLDGAARARLLALPTARILEILADRDLEQAARGRWLEQLRALADTPAALV
ncbi:MAG TPA: aminoglycoside phosphotransferase family protein [Candidatus Limnocylindria bacterium]|nr:aminoglycoside phosphotransferase family protein [Candidatus Limnocylindria bacterium]